MEQIKKWLNFIKKNAIVIFIAIFLFGFGFQTCKQNNVIKHLQETVLEQIDEKEKKIIKEHVKKTRAWKNNMKIVGKLMDKKFKEIEKLERDITTDIAKDVERPKDVLEAINILKERGINVNP